MTQLQPDRLTQLHPTKFKLDEYVSNTWQVRPEHDTPFDAVLAASYWAHVSAQMKPGDTIRVLAEDMSYWAELLVMEAGKLFARVALLRKVDLQASQVFSIKIPDGFELKWRGKVKKWCVLRGQDELKDGLEKAGAEQWLRDHLQLGKSAA